jgi:hypothetical protein
LVQEGLIVLKGKGISIIDEDRLRILTEEGI